MLDNEKPIEAKLKVIVCLLIFLVSLWMRTLSAADMASSMYGPDQPCGGMTEYNDRAVLIAEGHGVLFPDSPKHSDTALISYPPGYSIFLAMIYHFASRDYFAVQLTQNLLNSLSCVLIFLIAAQLVGWRVGVIAGLLAAVSHHLSYYSNFILPDALCALPLLASAYLLIKAERDRTSTFWLPSVAGTMLGLSIWLRPNSLLLGPFIMIILAATSNQRSRSIKNAAIVTLFSLLVVAPITIRNYLVYGEFVPVSTHLGIVLWEGIGESSGDRFGAVATDDAVAQQDAVLYGDPRYAGSWATPDGIQRDRDHVRKSVAIILHHPFWYAGVMLGRMAELVKYSAQAPLIYRSTASRLSEGVNPERQATTLGDLSLRAGRSLRWTRPLARALQRIAKESALLFILAGAAILFSVSWRKAFVIMAVPAYYLLAQSAMHVEFRYAIPMHYFLFVFAGLTWIAVGAAMWTGVKKLGHLVTA